MKRIAIVILCLSLLAMLLTACGTMSPSPSPKASPSPSPAASPSPETSPTMSPSETVSPSPEVSPTDSATPEPSAAQSAGGLEGSLESILQALGQQVNAKLPENEGLPERFESIVNAENCKLWLGLTPEELATYTDEASVSQAVFGFGYHVALIRCKDASAAKEVKSLIPKGFSETDLWVCAIPEECFVVDYENYVLMGVGAANTCAALREVFAERTGGGLGEADRFFLR